MPACADAFDRNTPAPHRAEAALASAWGRGRPRSAPAPARLARPDLPVRPAQLKRRGRPRPHADAPSTFVAPRYAGAISTSNSPAATLAPADARTALPRPATPAP